MNTGRSRRCTAIPLAGASAAASDRGVRSGFPVRKASSAPRPVVSWQSSGRWYGAVGLVLCGGLVLAFVLLSWPLPDGMSSGGSAVAQTPTPPESALLFRGWGKPELAIVLSGEQRGYLQPCGCSRPQLGGMARRYNFIQSLKRRGWPVAAVDLGDLAPAGNSPQKMLKYVTAMKGLDRMGYAAVSVGQNELAMPLIEALGNYTLNNPTPHVLAANLSQEGPGRIFRGLLHSWEILSPKGGPRVGVTALLGASVVQKVKDPSLQLVPRLRPLLGELRDQKVDWVLLLYQGSLAEARACAAFCARCRQEDPTLPAVRAILCLSGEEDEPPGMPDRVGATLIIHLGHKARYVGVLGVFRSSDTQQPWELRYQLVPIGEEYETKEGEEVSNPLLALMEDYAREVQRGNYLAKYPRSLHPVQVAFPDREPEYVGSEACRDCHQEEYRVWKNSAHAHAYRSLENARRPSLRQYDGECVICHVVGFAYKTGFSNEKDTPHLKNVGCENCHGPGSAHIARPRDKKLQALMNPWKQPAQEAPQARRIRELQMDKFCQSCHDIDNDVHWDFDQKWPKIVHRMKRQVAAPGAADAAPAQEASPPTLRRERPRGLRQAPRP
jgi:hypothetical protein